MSTLERAIAIAAEAHAGQVDKGGEAYILHPLRVMARVKDQEAQIVAVLHDVVEDSDWTLGQLEDEGFSPTVIRAVDALTRRDDETYDEFVERAGADPMARQVKMRDLEDNSRLGRISEMTKRDWHRYDRYRQALKRLRTIVYEEVFSRELLREINLQKYARWFVSATEPEQLPALLWSVGRFAEEAYAVGSSVLRDAVFYPHQMSERRMRRGLNALVLMWNPSTRDESTAWCAGDLPDPSYPFREGRGAELTSHESLAWTRDLSDRHVYGLLMGIGEYAVRVRSSEGPWGDSYPPPMFPAAGEKERVLRKALQIIVEIHSRKQISLEVAMLRVDP